MPRERIVSARKFSYSGLIDFKTFYKSIKNFWDSKGFSSLEKEHKEKVNEDGSKDIELSWSCEKEVTDYAKYIFEFSLGAKGLKLVKVDEREMDYVNELNIIINGDLELDYGKFFGDKPFNIFLRALYEKYLVGEEIKEHKKKIISIAEEFLDMIKTLTASYKY